MVDIAVGDDLHAADGVNRGAVYVLMLDADGSVKSHHRITDDGDDGPLADARLFGSSLTSLGDLDGDGIADLAVGAVGDIEAGAPRGAVHVLFMNNDGSVKQIQKIGSGIGGGPQLDIGDSFGASLASIGDVDGDGVADLAVGASGDNLGGAVYILMLNADGTAKSYRRISGGVNGGPFVDRDDHFGSSLAYLSDLDGDGSVEIVVGAPGDDLGGSDYRDYGSVHLLSINSDGTAQAKKKIASNIGGGPIVTSFSDFGVSVASLGDLDGNGVIELLVGAPWGNDGTLHLLHFQPDNHFSPEFTSPTTAMTAENTLAVMTVTATDADTPIQPIALSVVGGDDRNWFEISADGSLHFRRLPDFEVPWDANRDNVYLVTIEANDGHGGTTTQSIEVTVADVEDSVAVDFGDAPDQSVGTGIGDYRTLGADNGPSHRIVAGLYLGAYVDGEDGSLQDAAALADDNAPALPDDEDGIANPAIDLIVTAGAAPKLSLRATNTTGVEATLYGWIDYDGDGEFDNSTERASITVTSGTEEALVTLVFPNVPHGFVGTTYARFRLSSDAAAANSLGPAVDGEVEDYRVEIRARGTGQVDTEKSRVFDDLYARTFTSLGDLDGDGVAEIAAIGGSDGSYSDFGFHILFLNSDGGVKSRQRIASGEGGLPVLVDATFEQSIANMGDIDGDGVQDLAVQGWNNSEQCIFLFSMNTDGTVKNHRVIASGRANAPAFTASEYDGNLLAMLGDIDGDGIGELAIGVPDDSTAGRESGAVFIVFLRADGTVRRYQKIGSEIGGGPFFESHTRFGGTLAPVGDIDGDGIGDLAVGATSDFIDEDLEQFNLGGEYRGAVHVLMLNADGTVKRSTKIGDGVGGGPLLDDYDQFGQSIASLGDLNGDGIPDIAVGAHGRGGGDTYDGGRMYVLLLNADGSVKTRWDIGDNLNGGPDLEPHSHFGSVVSSLGDVDGDGVVDLAVQAVGGDFEEDGYVVPQIHLLHLAALGPDYGDAPDMAPGTGQVNYQTRAADDGPSHFIVDGLRLGGSVDGDDGTQANRLASADNGNGAVTGDEDGLVNPFTDLTWTVGSVPKVDLWVTNTTAADANLFGWFDYNADGEFDNATERASVAVASGTNSQIVRLMFPAVPNDAAGTIYARFRLSTDPAAADPTGAAADGEVEDYRLQIVAPSNGLADGAKTKTIGRNVNGGPDDGFGTLITAVGDLDGDGNTDIVTGEQGDYYTLFMNDEGTARESVFLASISSGWGESLAAIGDLNGDGVTDLVVTGEYGIYVIFVAADGTAKSSHLVIPGLYGESLAGVGDLDGDGVPDLAVGIESENLYGEYNSGAVYLLLLNSNGTVKAGQVIASDVGGGPTLAEHDFFGGSIATLGDIDGDGISDIAVGAPGDSTGSPYDDWRGAVYILYLNWDGTAKRYEKVANKTGGGPPLEEDDVFGGDVAHLGDLDGDGMPEIGVGAIYDDTGGNNRGAVYVLFLNPDGTAKRYEKVAHETNGGPPLNDYFNFGRSIAALGDLNDDGMMDFAVGSDSAIHVLFLQSEVLAGDYNFDGSVDAADYSVWRDQLGANVEPWSGADGDGNGQVGQEDYQLWKANFGKVLVSGSGAIDAGNGPQAVDEGSTAGQASSGTQSERGVGSLAVRNLMRQGDGGENTAGRAGSGIKHQAASLSSVDELFVGRRGVLWALGESGNGGRIQKKPPAEPGAGGRLQFAARHRDLALLAWRSSWVARGRGQGEGAADESAIDLSSQISSGTDWVFEKLGLVELNLSTR